ncbi:MAG TPA: hypothetical protein VMF06_25250 [Candidatus Limnocylindria bacterium]|jgi:hypothetical protein|nr:hypothetical protein [Candidatus Limnocylindria bacterium]
MAYRSTLVKGMQSHRQKWLSRTIFVWLMLGTLAAHAAIQFDVFPGYEGRAHAGAWFPVGIEVLNDGASFEGTIVVTPSNLGSQTVRVPVSLPNGTRKRLSLPVFCPSAGTIEFDAKLLDERGKVRAEQTQVRLITVGLETPLLGVLPANFAGRPEFPSTENQNSDWSPATTRIDPAIFTDNPIALEGLNAIYLNSARALELKTPQVDALLSWLNLGGHLIVALDQTGDLNSLPWLAKILPAQPGELTEVAAGNALQSWLMGTPAIPNHAFAPKRSKSDQDSNSSTTRQKSKNQPFERYQDLKADPTFSNANLPVFRSRVESDKVIVQAGSTPLIIRQSIGRGAVTFLAFNPEREPFKSWKLKNWFWAGLTGVPASLLGKNSPQYWGGTSVDSLMAAMTETTQVRKPPVLLLILLLVAYLIVIGPFDHWWLKRIRRPMLTWITFPCYVVLFSLLIYVIGYKLRAGRTEWNELHVIDVLPMDSGGERAALRGRSFCNLYSPANRLYQSKANLAFSGMRFEWNGVAGKLDQSRLTFDSKPNSYSAEFFVPVWSSELVVLDWLDYAAAPITCEVQAGGGLKIENHSRTLFDHVWVFRGASEAAYFDGLRGGASQTVSLTGGHSVNAFVQSELSLLTAAAASHESAFGRREPVRLDDWSTNSAKISLLSLATRPPEYDANQYNSRPDDSRHFVGPTGFDVAPTLDRDDYLVMAWASDNVGVPELNSFTAFRHRRGTLLRLAVSSEKSR